MKTRAFFAVGTKAQPHLYLLGSSLQRIVTVCNDSVPARAWIANHPFTSSKQKHNPSHSIRKHLQILVPAGNVTEDCKYFNQGHTPMFPAILPDVPDPHSLLPRRISPVRILKTANEAWGTHLWLTRPGETREERGMGCMGKHAA